MRYSRVTRHQSHRGRWLGVLLIVALLVYLGAAGFLGKAYSKWIAPWIMQRASHAEQEMTTPPPASGEPVPTSEPSNVQSEHVQIQMEGHTLYCLQLGAFAEQANADNLAASMQGRGAAGYIVEDTYFRVLAAGYTDQADAESVAERMRSDEAMECSIYEIVCPGLNIEITAPSDIAEGLKGIVADWEAMTGAWYEAFMHFDQGEWTANEVTDMLSEQNTMMQEHLATLAGYAKAVPSNPVIDGLQAMYSGHADRVSDMIVKTRKENTVEISVALMYNYIDMNQAYREFVQRAGGAG